MRALTALTALNGLLLAISGLFAFMMLGSGLPVLAVVSPIGLAYMATAAFLPVASLTAMVLAWRSVRQGNVRRALWIEASPLVAAACCVLALIGFHLAVSLTSHPS